jgi:hypothetical protein
MRAITTTASLRRDDPSLDAALNRVALPSGEIVSWAVAFLRPGTVHAPPPDRRETLYVGPCSSTCYC